MPLGLLRHRLAEKQNVAFVIAHIAEISRRKADPERAYPNLFAYCLQRLGLSEGSVALSAAFQKR